MSKYKAEGYYKWLKKAREYTVIGKVIVHGDR